MVTNILRVFLKSNAYTYSPPGYAIHVLGNLLKLMILSIIIMHQFVTFVSFQSNNRIKAMRRQLDEAEEEISREKAHRRKVKGEILQHSKKILF